MVNDADGICVELAAAFLLAASLVDSDGGDVVASVDA